MAPMGSSTTSEQIPSQSLSVGALHLTRCLSLLLLLSLPQACRSWASVDDRAKNLDTEPARTDAPQVLPQDSSAQRGTHQGTQQEKWNGANSPTRSDGPSAAPGNSAGTDSAGSEELVWQPMPLAPEWQSSSPHSFAEWLEATFTPGSFHRPNRDQLEQLAASLEQADFNALRAALILARSQAPQAAEILLERLEARISAPERAGDAADCVAAASFSTWHPAAHGIERLAERLANLAQGARPHPDLEVRVECARSAILLGQDSPIPFLIAVLRIGTPAGKRAGTFWPAPETTAWARGRAAEVLSWRAGTACEYPVDGSLAAREFEAEKLEKLLH